MRQKLFRSLASIVGQDHVSISSTNRLLYSQDMMSGLLLERKAGHPPLLPDLICWPKNLEEVSKVVKFAHRKRVPIVPYGAGSGVSGGTVPLKGGIILDLKRMNQIERIEVRKGNFYVTAQTGIIGEHLERELNNRGFTLGHFPSSILCATLGGYLACRSAGQLSSKYGKIEDMTDEVEVVLPDGTILPFGRPLKRLPSVRPKDLFVGSEGCLGIITQARLRIYPLPPTTRYRGLSFPNMRLALQAIREIMQAGLRPAVVRLYDPLDTILLKHGYRKGNLLRRLPIPKKFLQKGLHSLLFLRPGLTQQLIELISSEVLLILSFEGKTTMAEALEVKALEICRKAKATDLGEKPGLHWLEHRYSVSFKMPQIFQENGFVDTIEVATTWDKLPLLYKKIRGVLTKEILLLAHFSHAYAEGCSIYFTMIGKCGWPENDCKKYRNLWHDAMEACLEVGGTISHHHGIGILKAKYLPKELGEGMELYREIKKRLDPHNLMNPGKMAL